MRRYGNHNDIHQFRRAPAPKTSLATPMNRVACTMAGGRAFGRIFHEHETEPAGALRALGEARQVPRSASQRWLSCDC